MFKSPTHIRLSVKTRNADVITKVNNGATSAELAAEYGITWNALRDSIRNNHYKVATTPANAGRYKDFLAKVRANDAAAAAKAAQPVSTMPQASNSVKENNTGKKNEKQDEKAQKTISTSTNDAATTEKPIIYLVETGFLLRTGIDRLLQMDNGSAMFMIPRFCINELKRMSESQRLAMANDPVKDTATSVLMRLYAENVWKKRIIPFEPVEQGMIPKTPDVMDYKPRSFGVAEAALEIFIDTDSRVNVLTTSMEIQTLVQRVTQVEGLSNDISVTRVPSK